MIKSTATSKTPASQEYPKLMVSKTHAVIVLFKNAENDHGEGVVIFSDRKDGFNPLGEWSRAWHMPSFEPWSGKVVFEQD